MAVGCMADKGNTLLFTKCELCIMNMSSVNRYAYFNGRTAQSLTVRYCKTILGTTLEYPSTSTKHLEATAKWQGQLGILVR